MTIERERLEQALADVVGRPWVATGEPTSDVSGRSTGQPLFVVRPATTDEVAGIVRACRGARVPLVPVGRRTAYWQPLRLDDAVALDVARLDRIEPDADGIVVGAGATSREVDRALRAMGLCLPIQPDAFGDTSIGAMVATACTSGLGMGLGSIDDAVLGLEVVLGTGEVVRTGALGWTRRGPFVRESVPDATGLFVGAEGTLGVVTRIALARRAAPFRVRISAHAPDDTRPDDTLSDDTVPALAALGRAWAGRYDTLRLVRTFETAARAPVTRWELDAWIVSPASAREADERATDAAAALGALGARDVHLRPESAEARAGLASADDERYAGPVGGHDAFSARAVLLGVDVNAPYASVPELLRIARELVADQQAHGIAQTRIALYLAPDFVNLGIHATAPRGQSARERWTLEHAHPAMEALVAIGAIAYRAGHAWPASARRMPDALLRALKQACDPDRILHPGHPAWT